MARKGKIRAIVQRRPGAAKKTGGGPAKKTSAKKPSGTITGHSNVGIYKKFFKINANGGMVIDKSAVENAKNAAKAAARKPIAKPKSAGLPVGGGGGMAVGGPDSWRNDPNDSRNQPPSGMVEEQNRLRNQAAMPQNALQPQYHMPQNVMQSNQMQQNYAQSMFGSPPEGDYGYGMIDYQPAQPDYSMYGGPAPVQQPTSGGGDWRRPNQNQLGVVTPDEFIETKSTQPEPEEGFLGFFSTLSTEEMIALACGGAGFLLFIIVIIVIIFKLRKKSKRKKKKTQDNERSAWVNRNQSNASNHASPPVGFMQHSYRSLPGEKDPEHIARIQARNLPAPPLSYTQSAGVTGITTASGTYMSDERPSMRHKD